MKDLIDVAAGLQAFCESRGRQQEWMDVRMTIVRQGKDKLDWDYIFTQLRPLAEAKETPEILDQLIALQARY